MIYSKHRFTLDMQVAHSQIAIPVTVGDTGKTFYISLTDGGEPFKLSDGSLAMLTIKRPTGTFLQAFCPIVNGSTVVYDFLQNENTAAVEGIHKCELTLYGPTSEVISSPWFTMVVSRRVVNGDDLNITDEDRSAVDAMIAAESSRQSAEYARINAESGRVAAESQRVAYYEEFVARVNSGEFGVATTKTVTLSVGSWLTDAMEGYIYRVSVAGVTADPAKSHVFYSVPSDIDANTAMDMEKEVAKCWVRLSKQEDGAVVFKSLNGTAPTIDIAMNILVIGV
ncbi:MAG: hypothetical protein U0K87_05060 [Ruminococcus sp.]|nr:hypothetical protein [Ruminococcus sp.]